MKRVVAYIRPHKLEDVRTAVANMAVTGFTVSDVRGTGNRPEKPVTLAGQELFIALPLRSKLEIVVQDDEVEPVLQAILSAATTGQAGDGKVFVENVEEAIRIRTEQTGPGAV